MSDGTESVDQMPSLATWLDAAGISEPHEAAAAAIRWFATDRVAGKPCRDMDWRPGDVALAEVEGIPNRRVFRRDRDWAYVPDPAGEPGYACASDREGLVQNARPLIVIDPGDDGDLERLALGINGPGPGDNLGEAVALLRGALLNFAEWADDDK